MELYAYRTARAYGTELYANIMSSSFFAGETLQELEMLFREMSDRARRADMVNAAKNVCLDMDTLRQAVVFVGISRRCDHLISRIFWE